MFFSVIEAAEGREREAAFAPLDGPYAEHQWLWRFFPAEQGAPRDFLFRATESERGRMFNVVSAREPRAVSDAWSVRVKRYAPQLRTGQLLEFELRANPVVTTRRDGKQRRDDVVMSLKKKLLAERGFSRWADWKGADRPAEQELVAGACEHWLCASESSRPSRAGRAGFRVVNGTFRADGYRQQRGGGKEVRFSTVDLAGVLEVEDPELFGQALGQGIGRGRAFGCGLMLVRPA